MASMVKLPKLRASDLIGFTSQAHGYGTGDRITVLPQLVRPRRLDEKQDTFTGLLEGHFEGVAMKSIVLPVGTEHALFGDLAHLIADALWPDVGANDDRLIYACACINVGGELARAVKSGALPVKDPLTLGSHTFPMGDALNRGLVTVNDLREYVAANGLSVIVEAAEPQTLPGPHAGVELDTAGPDDKKPWLAVDQKDPSPAHPWYTSARYFARKLVFEDSTLLKKKSILAAKVSKSLSDVGIKKRGGCKPFDGSTVLKAFSKVILG